MKQTHMKKRFLTLAVALATVGGLQGVDATSVSQEQMQFNKPAVGVAVTTAGEKTTAATMAQDNEDLRQRGLADNPALTVGASQSIDMQNVQALYVSEADQAQLAPYLGRAVTKIDIIGASDALRAELLGQLTTKVGDKADMDKINSDITTLGNSGVFAQITPVMTPVPEGVQLAYRVTVNPTVRELQFVGNTVFPSEYLAQLMAIPQGSTLNTVTVSGKVREIENLYLQQGYILASVTDVAVNEDGVLQVSVAEGRIEDIVLKGNKKTKDYVIERELRFKRGDIFNKFLAQRSLERLYNLGFFEDVNVRLLPGKEPHAVVVEIDLLEQKTGVITVGAGYSKSDGFVGILEFGENNFRGSGDKVNVHWEFGGSGKGKNYQISYTRPWLDDKGTSLSVSYYNRVVEYEDYNENSQAVARYDKRRKGYSLSLGRATGEYNATYLTWESRDDRYDKHLSGFNYGENAVYKSTPFTYEKDKKTYEVHRLLQNSADGPKVAGEMSFEVTGDKTKDEAERAKITKSFDEQIAKAIKLPDLQGRNFKDMDYIGKNFGRTNSLSLTHVYDSRDNYFNPTRGQRLSLTGTWAGHGLGGNFSFYKFLAEGRAYKKVGSNQVLALRLIGGYSTGDIPYSELFSLGGANNLRGYEDDQFKGNKMYAATLEYRFPIVKKVQGVVFGDVGNAWGVDQMRIPWYHDSNKVHWSAGVGLRVQTPIGPIRLDYAHGEKNKFHFSFGGQF